MYPPKMTKAPPSLKVPCLLVWAHLGLNQGPPDYESGALTNWAIGPKWKLYNTIPFSECKFTTLLQNTQVIYFKFYLNFSINWFFEIHHFQLTLQHRQILHWKECLIISKSGESGLWETLATIESLVDVKTRCQYPAGNGIIIWTLSWEINFTNYF